jgi:hypothetical protein
LGFPWLGYILKLYISMYFNLKGYIPLHLATNWGNQGCMEELFENPAVSQADKKTQIDAQVIDF